MDSDLSAPFDYTVAVGENDSAIVWVRAINTTTGCVSDWYGSNTGYAYPVPETGMIITEFKPGINYGDYLDIVCSGDTGIYSTTLSNNSTYRWTIPSLSIDQESINEIEINLIKATRTWSSRGPDGS